MKWRRSRSARFLTLVCGTLAGLIHGLGPPPLYELLRQLDGGADLHQTLEAYARLPAEFVAAHGVDRLMPLRAIVEPQQ